MMEKIICKFCHQVLDEPIQCLNCQSNFCRNHIEDFKEECYLCKIKPFKYKENMHLSTCILDMYSNFECNLCDYKTNDQKLFLSHLMEKHKNEIIHHFNKSKNSIPIDNYSKNTQNSNSNMSDEKENTNIPKKPEIQYCGKYNELIKCNCCPDHICKKGNCLCVNCMKININLFKLEKGELINRAGKFAKLIKGNYFCGTEYDKLFENILGMKFKKHSKCQLEKDSCDDCKVLNKFKDVYKN